ncbi:hypothetical protein KC354_g129 [Hortaea werneckii]|nr:hypothetical protein KC354_g129 [Hortaea werneckii]
MCDDIKVSCITRERTQMSEGSGWSVDDRFLSLASAMRLRLVLVSLMLFGKFASAKTLCASSQVSQRSGRCYPAYIPRYIVIKAGHAESIVPQQLHMERTSFAVHLQARACLRKLQPTPLQTTPRLGTLINTGATTHNLPFLMKAKTNI